MEAGVASRISNKGWSRRWLLGWRDICRPTDTRTVTSSALPRAAVNDKFLLELPTGPAKLVSCLIAARASFIFDYTCRQKLGGTSLKYFTWKQLPTLTPAQGLPHADFISPRVCELIYVAADMKSFALDMGDRGTPFRWEEGRRQVLRAELDALCFHLYEISLQDAEYVLESFPVVRRQDEAKYGSYRTKELILAEYDRMAAAGVSLENPLVDGENYTSTLNPPPGHGPRHPSKA